MSHKLSISGKSRCEGQHALQVGVVETKLQTEEVVAPIFAEDVVDTTEKPQLGGASIRLVSPDGESVAMGKVHADEHDDRILVALVEEDLEVGVHTVRWRGMGPDGHVVRGEFSFALASAASGR